MWSLVAFWSSVDLKLMGGAVYLWHRKIEQPPAAGNAQAADG
ncbi:hypothetical protein [Kamptonema formosum]|nr:hypothetical protein [Oscillatoria sp. PCC 10802]